MTPDEFVAKAKTIAGEYSPQPCASCGHVGRFDWQSIIGEMLGLTARQIRRYATGETPISRSVELALILLWDAEKAPKDVPMATATNGRADDTVLLNSSYTGMGENRIIGASSDSALAETLSAVDGPIADVLAGNVPLPMAKPRGPYLPEEFGCIGVESPFFDKLRHAATYDLNKELFEDLEGGLSIVVGRGYTK